jgi:hypothetical protein
MKSLKKPTRGGAGRGQGRKVIQPAPDAIDSQAIIAELHALLDAHPSKMIPQTLARKILLLLEMSEPVVVSDWHGEVL